MKKMMLLLPLLFSVNAFAFENPCADGNCTIKQIEAYNRANYKTPDQHIREDEEFWSAQESKWAKEKREAEARRDEFLRNYVYEEPKRIVNCVSSVYEKATAILGDDARNHITVTPDTIDQCSFVVKQFGDLGRGCDNLAALSGIAKMGFYQEETCKFEAEKWKVYLKYKDVLATPAMTPALSRAYFDENRVVDLKYANIVIKMNEQEKELNKKTN